MALAPRPLKTAASYIYIILDRGDNTCSDEQEDVYGWAENVFSRSNGVDALHFFFSNGGARIFDGLNRF